MHLQVGVKILIRNSEDQYLFIRRSNDGDVIWDIPGGRIHPGEPLLDALKREVKEEIGHGVVSTPRLIDAQDIFPGNNQMHVVRLTYEVNENIDEVKLSDEHCEYCWVNIEDAASLNVQASLQGTLDTVLNR